MWWLRDWNASGQCGVRGSEGHVFECGEMAVRGTDVFDVDGTRAVVPKVDRCRE